VTPETALKLAAAFGGGAQAWVNMQAAYDLWHAQRRIDVSDIPPMRAA
jgi:addiction module HigA family antidote